ncbi:postacrosomal sheath WW domain-binding protein-like [Amphibalanus amphitrite]|uniref:postacrosomal sheath WW domain-binding protein-like n=1 Tax=Amphibalanus amphitrite TaxID=1232801 RepID=UPI001C8FF6E7|nr:postacrosomal sheath WW domain-binding protein-like [Amphibalanus amphitrite]
MYKQVIVLCLVLACAYGALLPLAYSGAPLAYSGAPLAYSGAPLAYSAAPLAYSAAPLAYAAAPTTYAAAAGAFPSYETVTNTVSVAAEPVEQHGYTVKY